MVCVSVVPRGRERGAVFRTFAYKFPNNQTNFRYPPLPTLSLLPLSPPRRGVLLGILGGVVSPGSSNPDPILDQTM